MSAKRISKDDQQGRIIGYLIAPFLMGWIYVWENYVWIQWPISYWQWVALTIPLLIASKASKIIGQILAIIGGVSLVAQVAKWVGLISLPLIHR